MDYRSTLLKPQDRAAAPRLLKMGKQSCSFLSQGFDQLAEGYNRGWTLLGQTAPHWSICLLTIPPSNQAIHNPTSSLRTIWIHRANFPGRSTVGGTPLYFWRPHAQFFQRIQLLITTIMRIEEWWLFVYNPCQLNPCYLLCMTSGNWLPQMKRLSSLDKSTITLW